MALVRVHPYGLTPVGPPNRLAASTLRRGLLLRWEEDGVAGHADLFPWPELGDPDLDSLRSDLRTGKTSQLTDAALAWAQREAAAHRAGLCWFPAPDVRSHVSLAAGDRTQAPLAKAKLAGDDPEEAVAILNRSPATRFRFDLNGLFSDSDRATRWWSALSRWRDRIDFLEDPTDLAHVPQARAWFPGARIALDRFAAEELWRHADILVLKPSTSAPAPAPSFGGPLVVTSVMGHPVGQLQALHAAQTWRDSGAELLECGLATHHLYEAHPHREWVVNTDSCLRPSLAKGTGLGLSERLDALAWEAP